ncbi:MAG: NADH-quinone oxidoreductase subunit C [Sphingobacteriales bacterium]|nr:MAG: NADH-quinone oxidoreductase subunit C [Sphingobacteriales bacterium]
MAGLTHEQIVARIKEQFGEDLTQAYETYGMLTLVFSRERIFDAIKFLKEDAELNFHFLTDLCGIHYPDNKGAELAVVYHLHNLVDNIRIRFKVFTDVASPDVFSATALYQSANFMERETYDFYGINFVGHPNLIRILNVDEMDYFPMRKEFPLEDQTRIDKMANEFTQ